MRFVRPSARVATGRQSINALPSAIAAALHVANRMAAGAHPSATESVARVRRRRVPRRDLEATCRPRPRRRWGCRHPRRTVRVIDNDATRRPDRGGPDHRFWGRHKAGCCRRWRERMRGSGQVGEQAFQSGETGGDIGSGEGGTAGEGPTTVAMGSDDLAGRGDTPIAGVAAVVGINADATVHAETDYREPAIFQIREIPGQHPLDGRMEAVAVAGGPHRDAASADIGSERGEGLGHDAADRIGRESKQRFLFAAPLVGSASTEVGDADAKGPQPVDTATKQTSAAKRGSVFKVSATLARKAAKASNGSRCAGMRADGTAYAPAQRQRAEQRRHSE